MDTNEQQAPEPGAQDNAPQTSDSAASQDSATEPRSDESYKQEIQKLREEAARYRNERNELRNDAEEYRKLKEAEKSEIERMTDQLTAAQHKAEQEGAERARLQVALKFGLANDDLDLLGVGDVEALEARAARIQALHQQANAAVSSPPSNVPRENLVPGNGQGNEQSSDAYPPEWR